jgi:hypothetical protein
MYFPLPIGDHRHAGAWNREPALTVGAPAPRSILHPGRHDGELDHVPPIERQIDDTLVVHNLPNRRALRCQHNCGGLHLDSLGHRTHFQHEIDARFLLCFDFQAGDRACPKTLVFHSHRVVTDLY